MPYVPMWLDFLDTNIAFMIQSFTYAYRDTTISKYLATYFNDHSPHRCSEHAERTEHVEHAEHAEQPKHGLLLFAGSAAKAICGKN